MALALVLFFMSGSACLLVGLAIGVSVAKPLFHDRETRNLRTALSRRSAECLAERAYSAGLREELTGQRLTIGELRARIDIGRVAS